MPGRVFILGAGASYADTSSSRYPSPLATQFFSSKYLRAFWPGGIRQFSQSTLGGCLRQYFGWADGAAATVNVEHVYSFLHDAAALSRFWLEDNQYLTQARVALLHYIVRVIGSTSKRRYGTPLYTWLARTLAESDSIITFNWDMLLDTALARGARPHQLLQNWWSLLRARHDEFLGTSSWDGDIGPGSLIKIYSSIGLVHCANINCVNYATARRITAWQRSRSLRCKQCGHAREVMLVPPHVNKSYLDNTQFEFLAAVAARQLSIATEIIVVGYSFPDSDFQSQSLFRAARLEPAEVGESLTNLQQITVVNPQITSRTYILKIRDLFGVGLLTAHGKRIPLRKYDRVAAFLADQRRPTPARN